MVRAGIMVAQEYTAGELIRRYSTIRKPKSYLLTAAVMPATGLPMYTKDFTEKQT